MATLINFISKDKPSQDFLPARREGQSFWTINLKCFVSTLLTDWNITLKEEHHSTFLPGSQITRIFQEQLYITFIDNSTIRNDLFTTVMESLNICKIATAKCLLGGRQLEPPRSLRVLLQACNDNTSLNTGK